MKGSWADSLLLALLLTLTCSARAQNTATDLGGTSWQLVKFQSSDDTTLRPDDKAKYTIAFGADSGVSTRIDCNRGRGTWKSSGANQLQFGPLALTRAMCPPFPTQRSHGQGLDAGAVVYLQGRPSLSIADGRRSHLRVRADRWIEIGHA